MPVVTSPYCAGNEPVMRSIERGEARGQALAEKADALGQDHAVDPVLDIGVVVAEVDLTEGILGDVRRLQQGLI